MCASIRKRLRQALSQLRLVGVNGPYAILLGADAYTELAETSDYGYPVLEHVKRLVEGKIIWAPAIDGAFVVTTRGGDLDLHIGQDASIGYLSHTDTHVRLYLQETFTFLYLTSESSVALALPPSHVHPDGATGPIAKAASRRFGISSPPSLNSAALSVRTDSA